MSPRLPLTRRRVGILLLATVSLLAAACGSTVQTGQTGQLQVANGTTQFATGSPEAIAEAGGFDDGLSLPIGQAGASTGTVASGGGVAGAPGAAPGAPPSNTGGTAPAPGAPGAPPPAGGTAPAGQPQPGGAPQPGNQPAAAQNGPGITPEEIVVGIAVADESSPDNSDFGFEGVTQGNRERYFEIAADEINKQGGIAGRRIRYSIYKYNTANGAQISQLEQAACEYWARDDPAFVVGPLDGATDNFLGCAEDNGLMTVGGGGLSAADGRVFAEYPHYIENSNFSLNRQMGILTEGLFAQGYFQGGALPGQAAKYAVVGWDAAPFVRAYEESLKPAMLQNGQQIDRHQRISRLQSLDQLGKIQAEIQGAVLRFKADGVTHVSFVEDDGTLFILFSRNAQSQQYKPRYGLTSNQAPTFLPSANLVPKEQMAGAVGVGWFPQFDVPSAEEPPDPEKAACLAMFERGGEKPADANNAAIMASICEEVQLYKAAIEAGGPVVNRDNFVRGVESLGNTFPSWTVLGVNRFGPGRHDGASGYRHLAWDPACGCAHYTSDLISAG